MQMNETVVFQNSAFQSVANWNDARILTMDELALIAGGFDIYRLGAATLSGAIGGAAGGAVVGALGGGVGALPGAGIGALGGAIGGAASDTVMQLLGY